MYLSSHQTPSPSLQSQGRGSTRATKMEQSLQLEAGTLSMKSVKVYVLVLDTINKSVMLYVITNKVI